MNIVTLPLTGVTLLKGYFTKNAGMNSVTSGAAGAFGALAVLAAQNTGNIDQVITFLSNHGDTGLYVAAVIAVLRTFIFLVAGSGKAQ
jgi:C4-dicarboxylate transporter